MDKVEVRSRVVHQGTQRLVIFQGQEITLTLLSGNCELPLSSGFEPPDIKSLGYTLEQGFEIAISLISKIEVYSCLVIAHLTSLSTHTAQP